MGMKRSVRETFAFKFRKEFAETELNVINFISGMSTVQAMPLLSRCLAFPEMGGLDRRSKSIMQRSYSPRDVWRSKVMKVEIPGQMQLLARRAYLNSSSHTTNSEKALADIKANGGNSNCIPACFTCILFSGRNICTYCLHKGA